MHRQRWPEPESFWLSDEPAEFRINGTEHCQHLKFKKWVEMQIEELKNEEAFHTKVVSELGDIEMYNDFDKNYDLPEIESVLKFSKSDFYKNVKKWKPKNDRDLPLKPAQRLEEKYRIVAE